ncbi:hypothetical protein [uncultured Gelidibacter sp.]|uniref:hypothetical protein n=1 Tax=uncultured Gelidibacter sp. TaxID=259318 RepID=UPI00260FEFBF|nr:hypothetical protein [uncultured Gelidibacter sp.]
MEKVIIILIFLVTATSCVNKDGINDLKELNLKGRVKSVVEIPYNVKDSFGEITKGKIAQGFLDHNIGRTFNHNGYLIEHNKYNDLGGIYYRTIYLYDKNSNINELNRYDSDGKLIFKYKYIYDNYGNEIEEARYNNEGILISKYKHEYVYDKKGNKTEMLFYDKKGVFKSKDVFSYDDNGNLIEFIEDFEEGSFKTKNSYKYNDKGNQIEWVSYKDGGVFDFKYINKYDSHSNIIKSTLSEYDTIQKTDFSYKYIFDEKNNWIRETQYTNGFPKKITERTIEYYD